MSPQRSLGVALSISAALSAAGLQAQPVGPGLEISKGRLLRDGRAYRAIGINYFSAFIRCLDDPADTSYRDGFKVLAEHGIPFVRFAASGFWPNQWELYFSDRTRYWELFDGVVGAAEEAGIGLIPSLFWYFATPPDLANEPCDQWGNPASNTIKLMRAYTTAVVSRYLDSPAILAWEFGNELNLRVDLPNAADHRPWVAPNRGTAYSRSERDDLTREMMLVALAEFARSVRAVDSRRMIISGNSIPRPAAYHLHSEGEWTQDSAAEYAAMLSGANPEPIDSLSIHLYPHVKGQYFADRPAGIRDILELSMQTAAEAGKPLFVGEWGAPSPESPDKAAGESEGLAFREILDAVVELGVPLSAAWVFDLPSQEGEWNISVDNSRAYMLQLIGETNARLR